MRKLLAALAVFCGVGFGATPVTISDTVNTPINGRPAVGGIVVSWPSFMEPDGTNVPAGSQTLTLDRNGAFSISLYPTDSASPTGSTVGGGSVFYTVVYQLVTGASIRDKWVVPTTGGTLKISNVLVPTPGFLRNPSGPTNPATCTTGDLFYNSTLQNQQLCIATNTWAVLLTQSQVSQGYLADTGAPGLVARLGDAAHTRPANATDVSTSLGYLPPNPGNHLSEYTASAGAARVALGIGSVGTHDIGEFLLSGQTLSLSVIPTNIPATSILGLGSAALLPSSAFLSSSLLNANNGVAGTDGQGKISVNALPAIPYALLTNTPVAKTLLSQFTNDVGFVPSTALSTVATSGDYNDLKNTPSQTFEPTGTATGLFNQAFKITNHFSELTTADARLAARNSLGISTVGATGLYTDLQGTPTLSAVALSGAWADIANKPTFGSIITANAGDYLGSAQLGVTVAPLDATAHTVPLQYLPTIPANKISGLPLAAFSGSWADLTNKPATFPAGGTASGDLCATYPAPVVCAIGGAKLSDLTANGGGLLNLNQGAPPTLANDANIAQALGYMPMNPTHNLGELTNLPLARTQLGLGSIATDSKENYLADTGGPGLVFRGQVEGTTRPAVAADIATLLTYTPLDQAKLGTASGPAVLGTDLKLLPTELPPIPWNLITSVPVFVLAQSINTANGIAGLDANAYVRQAQMNPALFDPPGAAASALTAAQGSSFQKANLFSEITAAQDKTTARTNLGIGTIGPKNIADFVLSTAPGAAQLGYLGSLTAGVQEQINALTIRIDADETNGTVGGGNTGGGGTVSPNALSGTGFTVGHIPVSAGGQVLSDSGKVLPQGTVVGDYDPQTLTNKHINASEVDTGTFAASQLPGFSGDASASVGSNLLTLASVNSTPGTYGDANTMLRATVDAKGRVTSLSPVTSSFLNGTNLLAGHILLSNGGNAVVDSGKGLPVGNLVGDSDVQTLTNKQLNAAEISSGVFDPARLPALTGDVSTIPGSTATTLATVNAAPGTYGDPTHTASFAVDAKGRITSITQTAITGVTGGSATVTPNTTVGFTNQSDFVVTHNLHTRSVFVQFQDTNYKFTEAGAVTATSVDAIRIQFSSARSGYVIISAGSSPGSGSTTSGTGTAGVAVQVNGATLSGSTVNFIDGTNSALTTTQNGSITNVQVNATGGSSGGTTTAGVSIPFTNQTIVTTLHNMNTRAVNWSCLDSAGNVLEDNGKRVIDANSVQTSFLDPQSGSCAVVAAVPGQTGPAGAQGPQGVGGPAASLTVGTVTTGAAGSQASVVNSGTNSAAVLNFVIPQGATGATGATGPAGPAGPTGATGPAGSSSSGPGGSGVQTGTLAGLSSAACSANGTLYLTNDSGTFPQLYVCTGSPLAWATYNGVGNSGALTLVNGVVDVTPQVVLKAATNVFTGADSFTNLQTVPGTFGALVACNSGTEGSQKPVTDSTTNTWGNTISGGGNLHVLAYCDGGSWTVMAR